MKYLIFTVLFSLLSECMSSFAEYRVYQYLAVNKDLENVPFKLRLFNSSLTPRSFRAYHGLEFTKIQLMRSWICRGDTGDYKAPCLPPSVTNTNFPTIRGLP